MRALIQRVKSASVKVDGRTVGQIKGGLLALIGICDGDAKADADWILSRVLGARVWPEGEGESERQWRTNVVDFVDPETGEPGQLLVVSQFTLYGHCKSNKPDFHRALGPDPAKVMFDELVGRMRAKMKAKAPAGSDGATGAAASASAAAEDSAEGLPVDRVATGEFGADMQVSLVNDGPVTLMLDSRNKNNADPSS